MFSIQPGNVEAILSFSENNDLHPLMTTIA